MKWQGDNTTRIDRFDARALLDFLPPTPSSRPPPLPEDEREIMNELQFERYRDLVEADRLEISEEQRLNEVDAEWTNLLARHKALLSSLDPKKQAHGIAYDYGTTSKNDDKKQSELTEEEEDEMQLLKEEDILQYIDDLSEKERAVLNALASKYGIRNYFRLLRVAKRELEEKLCDLKADEEARRPKQGKRSERRRARRRARRTSEGGSRYSSRDSPTYEAYGDYARTESESESDENGNESEDGGEEDAKEEFILEFGSSDTPSTASVGDHERLEAEREEEFKRKQNASGPQSKPSSAPSAGASATKKLTPLEKLRLRMRQGLNQQIASDEQKKQQRAQDQRLERLSNETEAWMPGERGQDPYAYNGDRGEEVDVFGRRKPEHARKDDVERKSSHPTSLEKSSARFAPAPLLPSDPPMHKATHALIRAPDLGLDLDQDRNPARAPTLFLLADTFTRGLDLGPFHALDPLAATHAHDPSLAQAHDLPADAPTPGLDPAQSRDHDRLVATPIYALYPARDLARDLLAVAIIPAPGPVQDPSPDLLPDLLGIATLDATNHVAAHALDRRVERGIKERESEADPEAGAESDGTGDTKMGVIRTHPRGPI
ncbi:uncharacterized protein VTP21DRAFT_5042 [Calcarisporiella thermophila]|uniref:uncharacterized protein n=1 Tax=Calcarisporiella thermophila TaxID=911321 RepID=UPI0037437B7D